MAAARNAVASKVVALAWAKGQVCNADIAAMMGCKSEMAGTYLLNAERGGHLVRHGSARPFAWTLSPARSAWIDSLPAEARVEPRTQAEQLARRVERIRAERAARREREAERRRRAVEALREARAIAREERRQARAQAEAEKTARRTAANPLGRLTAREPTAAQRPPMLPGSAQLVRVKGAAAPVVVRHRWEVDPAAPVQDPRGLLTPAAEATAAAAPVPLLRGGVIAPADGPYIRRGALAHQAVPSRVGDVLVEHRPPRTQP